MNMIIKNATIKGNIKYGNKVRVIIIGKEFEELVKKYFKDNGGTAIAGDTDTTWYKIDGIIVQVSIIIPPKQR